MNFIFKSLELEYVDDWCKYLFLNNRGIVVDRNNSRFNVVTWSRQNFAATKNFTTLLLYLYEAVLEFFHSPLRVQRSNQSFLGHWVSNIQGFVGLNHSLDKCIIHRLMQKYSSQSGTTLATGSYGRENTSLKGKLKICVWQNNDSIVSSQLKDCASEASVNISTNRSANCGRTSE